MCVCVCVCVCVRERERGRERERERWREGERERENMNVWGGEIGSRFVQEKPNLSCGLGKRTAPSMPPSQIPGSNIHRPLGRYPTQTLGASWVQPG